MMMGSGGLWVMMVDGGSWFMVGSGWWWSVVVGGCRWWWVVVVNGSWVMAELPAAATAAAVPVTTHGHAWDVFNCPQINSLTF